MDNYGMSFEQYKNVCIPAEEPSPKYPTTRNSINGKNIGVIYNLSNSNEIVTMEDSLWDVENLLVMDEVRRLKEDREVDVLWIDPLGNLKIKREGMIKNYGERYVANFTNPSLKIFENAKTGEQIYSVSILLGKKEATFFLNEKQTGEANIFLKKIRSVGGEFMLGRRCSKKDIAVQLWSLLLNMSDEIQTIPEKRGWFFDKNAELHFWKGETWCEMRKKC